MTPEIWNQLGWQGISFLKPHSWELGRVEGNGDKGYLRLDDHLFTRIELRWQRSSRNLDLERIRNRHLKDLAREAKRKKIPFRVLKTKGYRVNSLAGKFFCWEGDFYAVNIIVQCRECRRLLMLRVLAEHKDQIIVKTAERIFRSLEDHPQGGKVLWSVFGFSFTTPTELKLEGHAFLSGDIRLDFARGHDTLIFERLSIANIILKDKDLSQWAEGFCRSKFKEVDLEAAWPAEPSAGQRVSLNGREHSRFRFFKKRFFKGIFWHSEQANQIFGLLELVKKKEDSAVDNLTSEVRCP